MILNVAGTHNKDDKKNSARTTDDDCGGKGVHNLNVHAHGSLRHCCVCKGCHHTYHTM